MKSNIGWTVFRYRLVRLRGQILGWGISLALLGLLLVQFYGTVVEQQEQLTELLESYPQEFIAFFGDFDDFATPSGFLGIEFFSYMPLILGIFGVLIGSGLFVGDEESGRLDLILAHPVSRMALYWGRLCAFVVATFGILAITYVGLAAPAGLGAMDVGWLDMALPVLSLLGAVLFFGVLSLWLSMMLPSRRTAAMASGVLLVGSYFLTAFARINPDLEPVAKLSPLYYYQGGDAIDGLNVAWFAGLLAVAVLFSLLAWWRFERRDIRVGGEGGWQRPALGALWRLLPQRLSRAREVSPVEGVVAQR